MVVEGPFSYFRTTNQLKTKNINLVSEDLVSKLSSDDNVSIFSYQILLQTDCAGLFIFDSSTFLLINRKPKTIYTLVLTSDVFDDCHYVIHESARNIEIIKYSEKKGDRVYN